MQTTCSSSQRNSLSYTRIQHQARSLKGPHPRPGRGGLSSLLWVGMLAWALGSFLAGPLVAGLCPADLETQVHRDEALEMEAAGYSASSSCVAGSTTCWIGTRSYNERVLSCNRSRDIDVIRFGPIKDVPFVHKPAGRLLDERSAEERQFEADLEPRMVTGKYRYLGAFKKWYGYLLERQAGEWLVTVTLDFKFPNKEEDKLHIPPYLMFRLSETAGGATLDSTTCSSYSRDDETDGMIEVKGSGGAFVDRSCRIGRDTELFLAIPDTLLPVTLGTTDSRPATEWSMLWWREVVTQAWTRPGFRLQAEIANFVGRPGEIDRQRLDLHRGGNVVFEVELHHNEDRWNNMFRPVTVGGTVYKAIYAGESEAVVAHEFSHSLGLGDDYPGRDTPPADKDCEALSGQDSGDQLRYIMCDESETPQDVKSIYMWIVSQRYFIGKDLYCGGDDECENNEYCSTAGLLGHRTCQPKRTVGEGCSRPANCLSGMCPAIDLTCAECNADGQCEDDEYCSNGTPLKANTCESKGRVGAACTRPNQCISGMCPAIDLKCAACTGDGTCSPDQYCEAGKVGTANRCRQKKTLGESCTRPDQCLSGKCPAIDLVCAECNNDSDCDGDEYCRSGAIGSANECLAKQANGGSCTRPDQCISGLCPVIDLKCAECTDDSHCDNDEYCRAGAVLSQNECRAKQADGASCTRPDQCISGLCPAIDLKCAECTDDAHCDNDEYCRAGAVLSQNECRSLKDDGDGCTRPGQCESGLCPVPDFVCVECTSNSHCNNNQYCDKGVALGFGNNQCKTKKSEGQSCSKNSMCETNCCKYMALKFHSECRPSNKC